MLYGIPHSGWKSPQWKWGSAVGTGHDCAAICRDKFRTRESRQRLVDQLVKCKGEEKQFEEIKLVLALTWQRGRWTGQDGGKGGYRDVLANLAEAKRYEDGTKEECAKRFVEDMRTRICLVVDSNSAIAKKMDTLLEDCSNDILAARQRCSGLVLQAVGFVESGC